MQKDTKAYFEKAKNDTYNIASGQGVSLVDLAQKIIDKMQVNLNINIEKNRTGEVIHFVADITKAQSKLQYSPIISINEGLKKAIDWYTKNNT